MEEERKRPIHGRFNIIHTESAMRADIYVAGDDPMNAWALAHRVVREIEGEQVQSAPIEAVIIGKLRYFALGGSDCTHCRCVELPPPPLRELLRQRACVQPSQLRRSTGGS